jgi:hypothetical protein
MMRLVATGDARSGAAVPGLAASFEGRMVTITDGDTIRVLRGTEQVRVRCMALARRGGNRLDQGQDNDRTGERITNSGTARSTLGASVPTMRAGPHDDLQSWQVRA